MRRLVMALGALTASSAATAMPVAAFLAKAQALQAKGPLALFSGDLKLLANQVKFDAARLRADNEALVKAGKPKAYCVPPGGAKLDNNDVLAAMQAVPPAARAGTDSRDALRAMLARKHPCPK